MDFITFSFLFRFGIIRLSRKKLDNLIILDWLDCFFYQIRAGSEIAHIADTFRRIGQSIHC